MDKIWDRKSFEVGGHWPLWRGWKNRMTTQNRQKSNKKINNFKTAYCNFYSLQKVNVKYKDNKKSTCPIALTKWFGKQEE